MHKEKRSCIDFELYASMIVCIVIQCSSGCTELEANFTENTFNSHAGYGLMNYSNYMDECWIIHAPSERTLVGIRFNNFVLEFHSTCEYDSLEVYCGNGNDKSDLVDTFCGNVTPYAVYSTDGGSLYLHFKTDSSIVDTGFEVTYTALFVGNVSSSNFSSDSSYHQCNGIGEDVVSGRSAGRSAGLSAGAIAGIVISVIIVLIIVITLVCCFNLRNNRNSNFNPKRCCDNCLQCVIAKARSILRKRNNSGPTSQPNAQNQQGSMSDITAGNTITCVCGRTISLGNILGPIETGASNASNPSNNNVSTEQNTHEDLPSYELEVGASNSNIAFNNTRTEQNTHEDLPSYETLFPDDYMTSDV